VARAWAYKAGFDLFPEKGYESISLLCAMNTRNVDFSKLNKWLEEKYNCTINTGYGRIKGVTFRISTMGDETTEAIEELLARLDEGLEAVCSYFN
jgi:aspartate aminotransferase-like enzyme